jgi:hypothetical protein
MARRRDGEHLMVENTPKPTDRYQIIYATVKARKAGYKWEVLDTERVNVMCACPTQESAELLVQLLNEKAARHVDPYLDIINTRLTIATMIKATTKRLADGSYCGVLKVTPVNDEPYEVLLREPTATRKEARWRADEVRRAFIREGGLPQRQEGA